MIDDASMDAKFDDFAEHYQSTPGRTDTAAYRDAIDASKNDYNDYANWKNNI